MFVGLEGRDWKNCIVKEKRGMQISRRKKNLKWRESFVLPVLWGISEYFEECGRRETKLPS